MENDTSKTTTLTCVICHVFPCICPDDRRVAIERERCARIAEEWDDGSQAVEAVGLAARLIAAKIRSGQ